MRLRLGDCRAARDRGKAAGPIADADQQRVVLLDDLDEVGALERRRLNHHRQQPDQLQLRIEQRLYLANADAPVIQQPAHAIHRLLIELDWR